MGAIFPVLDKDVDGIDISSVSGKMINRYEPELSEIAGNAGLASIMDFFGASPAEYFDENEFEEVELSEEDLIEKWFEPKSGRQTIKFLIKYLHENQDTFSNETSEVISDLEDFEKVLQKAEESGAKWHVEIEI